LFATKDKYETMHTAIIGVEGRVREQCDTRLNWH